MISLLRFWYHVLPLVAFSLTINQVCATEYSFCSGGSIYTFSTAVCPGGVLLKNPLLIDEPCHCFGSDLQIYTTCGDKNLFKKQVTSTGCAKPLIDKEDEWNGQVRLLIPVAENSNNSNPKESCASIPNHCIRNNRTIAFLKVKDHEEKLADRNSSRVEEDYEEDEYEEEETGSTPSEISISDQPIQKDNANKNIPDDISLDLQVPEVSQSIDESSNVRLTREEQLQMETTMTENKRLMRHIADVKAGHIPDPAPNTKTFKILKKSMRVVAKIIPNTIMKDINLYEAYLAFRELFGHIDEDERADKHLNFEDYNSIVLSLDLCLNNVRELQFKTTGRPRKIESFYLMSDIGFTVKDPKLPDDRAHNIDGEDYIVGIMWKVFDIVLSACIQEFKRNPGSQFEYVTSIENVFLRESVQKRWYQPQIATAASQAMVELISHPDIKILMENLDKIDAAVHIASTFQNFLSKPKRILIHDIALNSSSSDVNPGTRAQNTISQNGMKNSRRKRDEPIVGSETILQSTTTRSKNIKEQVLKPRKANLAALEIWDGAAYCLQKKDIGLPAGFANTLPEAQTLC